MMVRPRAGPFELRVKNWLLPRDFYATFDTEEEAPGDGSRLGAPLAQGIVAADLLPDEGPDPRIELVIRA
jgi:hypothetical protein